MRNKKEANEKITRILNELKRIQLELNEEIDMCINIEDTIRSGDMKVEDKKKSLMVNSDVIFNNANRVNILDEAIEILEKIKGDLLNG